MRHRSYWLLGLGASLLLASGQLMAQTGYNPGPGTICPPPVQIAPQPTGPQAPAPALQPQPEMQAPFMPPSMPSSFSELAQAGTEAGGGNFNPGMFGDLGIMGRLNAPVVSGGTRALIPVIRRGAFRSADNASPLPSDRIYVFYSYFNDVRVEGIGASVDNIRVHRQTIGFEKSLLGNRASIGMHVPFLQIGDGYPGLDGNVMGDLSVIAKWAFLYDEYTGSGASFGAIGTFPTGRGPRSDIGGRQINSVYLQPYLGWVVNSDILYFQGFSSFAFNFNTNQNEPTFLSNSVGAGLWLIRNREGGMLRGIALPVEAHLLTPLDQRGHGTGQFTATDLLALVSGVNFVFTNNTTLGLAVGTPVMGPRFYDIEGQAFLNLRF